MVATLIASHAVCQPMALTHGLQGLRGRVAAGDAFSNLLIWELSACAPMAAAHLSEQQQPGMLRLGGHTGSIHRHAPPLP